MEIRSQIFMALRSGEVINDLSDWFVNEAVEVNLWRDADCCRVFTAEMQIKWSFYCQLDTNKH